MLTHHIAYEAERHSSINNENKLSICTPHSKYTIALNMVYLDLHSGALSTWTLDMFTRHFHSTFHSHDQIGHASETIDIVVHELHDTTILLEMNM